jgi:transposase
MTRARDRLSKAESVLVNAIEASVVALAEARLLLERFHKMIRGKIDADLDVWIIDASESLLASFAKGIVNDKAAVRVAIIEPWSKGQTEGRLTALK